MGLLWLQGPVGFVPVCVPAHSVLVLPVSVRSKQPRALAVAMQMEYCGACICVLL